MIKVEEVNIHDIEKLPLSISVKGIESFIDMQGSISGL